MVESPLSTVESIQQGNKSLRKSMRYDNQIVRQQIENYAKYPDIQEGVIDNRTPKATLLENDYSKMNLNISLLILDFNLQNSTNATLSASTEPY